MTKATWKSDVEQYEALRDCLIALSYSLKVMAYPGITAAIRQHNDMLVLSNIWFLGKPVQQWEFYQKADGIRNLNWLVNQVTGVAIYFGLVGVIHSYQASGSSPRMAEVLVRYNRHHIDLCQWQRSRQLEDRHQEFNLPKTAFYVLREKLTNGKVQVTGESS